MVTLESIAKKHGDWIRIAKYLGATNDECEDIVQDMYLKIAEIQNREGSLKRITHYSGGLNTIYVFKMLQTGCMDVKRANAKDIITDPCGNVVDSVPMEQAYSELMGDIKQAIDSLHDYDQMLLELHFVYGHSMRQIEKRTGIPTHSVFNSLKNAKKYIKNKAHEKYKNYSEERAEHDYLNRSWGHGRENNEKDGD